MNIFYISECPRTCAEYMVDKHVVKMIIESAQMLSTAHRILDGKESIIDQRVKNSQVVKYRKKKIWVHPNIELNNILYKATHKNHPSTIWSRTSLQNYIWLYQHFVHLCDEYTYRYKKKHLTDIKLRDILANAPKNIINNMSNNITEMPCCMPDEYKTSNDPVENYREYYRKDKADIHRWKSREKPSWI